VLKQVLHLIAFLVAQQSIQNSRNYRRKRRGTHLRHYSNVWFLLGCPLASITDDCYSVSKVGDCAGLIVLNAQFTFMRSLFHDNSEIDALTKRCKASENAFLGVYKLLADAPDPYPLLEAAVVSSQYSQSYRKPPSETIIIPRTKL
jgi:hypothetical protein